MWSYNYTALPDEFYHYDKQSDELYHYGVLGMRWGHRKAEYYDKRAAVNRAKVEKRKSSIGKSIAENRSSTNKFYADRRRAIKSAKGLRKFGEAGGHANTARRFSAQSAMNMRQANIAKTRIFKQGYKVKSMNSRYGADYHKRIANSRTLGQRFVNKYAKAFSTPHTTYAGRTTTIGKEFTENILTLGVVPTVKDLNYLHKHKGEFGKVK